MDDPVASPRRAEGSAAVVFTVATSNGDETVRLARELQVRLTLVTAKTGPVDAFVNPVAAHLNM